MTVWVREKEQEEREREEKKDIQAEDWKVLCVRKGEGGMCAQTERYR